MTKSIITSWYMPWPTSSGLLWWAMHLWTAITRILDPHTDGNVWLLQRLIHVMSKNVQAPDNPNDNNQVFAFSDNRVRVGVSGHWVKKKHLHVQHPCTYSRTWNTKTPGNCIQGLQTIKAETDPKGRVWWTEYSTAVPPECNQLCNVWIKFVWPWDN